MGLQNHKLTVAGVEKTLAEWNATKCVVVRALGGADDRLTLTVSRPIDAGPQFGRFAPCSLKDPAGTVRFRGLLTKVTLAATGRSEKRTYNFEGPSYYLKRIVFRQRWLFATTPSDFQDDFSDIVNQLKNDPEQFATRFGLEPTSRVILGRGIEVNPAVGYGYIGEKLSLAQQLQEVLDYAKTAPEGGAPFNYQLSDFASVDPPCSEELDLRCHEAMLRVLRWVPHLLPRWDYSVDPPLLHFADVTSGVAFGNQLLDLRASASPWTIDFMGSPRWDLLSPGVELTYLYGKETVDPDDASSFFKIIKRHLDASPVVANGAYGIDRSTIKLSGDVVNYGGGHRFTSEGEPVPADGLAAALHTAYARLYYELSFTRQAEEVDWEVTVGQRWDVTGADAEYATAAAICQTITRDIGAGTTAVECGPPTQLGLGDRLDVLRANRLRHPPESGGEQQFGYDKPKAGDSPPGGGGGTLKTILVLETDSGGVPTMCTITGFAAPSGGGGT